MTTELRGAASSCEVSGGRELVDWQGKLLRWLFWATTFLSAFLLFQVQPLIGKAILPRFGGTSAVWTTCILFFQFVLLMGYGYSHLITQWFSQRTRMAIHFVVIVAALALLPILPGEASAPGGDENPTWAILGLLAATVGGPFFVVSTTAPLIQVWWGSVGATSPYRLYAISNAGSLLALLSYPLLVEPALGNKAQAYTWSMLFAILAAMLLGCNAAALLRGRRASPNPSSQEPALAGAPASVRDRGRRVPLTTRTAWLLLPAMGTTALLSTTDYLCQDLPATPLTWVAPLTLYLLSFILCFGRSSWHHRGIFTPMMIVTTCLLAYEYGFANQYGYGTPNFRPILWVQFVVLSSLFAVCMVCHGEVERIKPPTDKLTLFYLHIALGGALGGAFVGVIAPIAFFDYYELPLVLLACWCVALGLLYLDWRSSSRRGVRMTCWGLLVLVFFGYAAFLSAGVIGRNYGVVAIHRNFYGVLKVVAKRMEHPTDVDYLQLKNGGVLHGGQFLDEKLQMVPTTYFSRESGVGRAFSLLDATAGRRVGVVGLGAGTVAAYGRKGDYFRFYEINPAVVFFAARYFTYCKHLAQVGAQLEPAVGDARLLLQRESSQQFDLLVVDAFSGDAIPMHLLTREAGALYFHHLKPTGILAVHISNRHLDLLPVVKGMVAGSAMDIAPIDNPPGKLAVAFSSWVLVGRPGSLKGLAQFSEPAAADTAGKVVVWTDGYSSLFRSLR